MEKVILVRYGEIHLKGQNRPFFEKMLLKNIKKAVAGFPGVVVEKGQGRFYICNPTDEKALLESLSRVFGLISISPAWKTEKEIYIIEKTAQQLMKDVLVKYNKRPVTFKVESRRSDKRFFLDSMELSRRMGAFLLDKFPQLRVDIHNPDIKINIEIRESAYIYHEIIPGVGGMPVGSNGKAALLLSGGIDSPVAGWMIAKRGLELTTVHYHSFPYTSDRAKEKVVELTRIMTRYCGPIRLHVVPFTRIQEELYEKCPESQLTILMRRFMMKIAEIIAVNEGAGALVTGESIGQVASQTLDSLIATDDAVQMPVFRPLIGLDKIEIIDIAQKIDTYNTSILPYEDCCTLFVPRHPVTHPRLNKVREAEKMVDREALIKEALENIEVIEV